MMPLDNVSASTIDAFMIEFIGTIFDRVLAKKPTAPETGPALLRFMRESQLFREYIFGQVKVLETKTLDPTSVIRGSIALGYMLAEYVARTRQ